MLLVDAVLVGLLPLLDASNLALAILRVPPLPTGARALFALWTKTVTRRLIRVERGRRLDHAAPPTKLHVCNLPAPCDSYGHAGYMLRNDLGFYLAIYPDHSPPF